MALSGSIVASVTPTDAAPQVGDQIDVMIHIDVSNVDPPDNKLGSYTGSLTWDPAVLAYNSTSGPPAGFTGKTNTDSVDSGTIIFNGANASGATGNILVITVTFDVVGAGSSSLDLDFSAMSAADTFVSYLPSLSVNDSQIEAVDAPDEQTIELLAGWNLISSFVEPENPSMVDILNNLGNDMILLKNGAGEVYWPAYGIDQIGNWDINQAYLVYMANPTTLIIVGTAVDPDSNHISLSAGWNYVAYLVSYELTTNAAFASIFDEIMLVKNGNGDTIFPDLGIDTILTTYPGQGYQINMKNPDLLIYPGVD